MSPWDGLAALGRLLGEEAGVGLGPPALLGSGLPEARRGRAGRRLGRCCRPPEPPPPDAGGRRGLVVVERARRSRGRRGRSRPSLSLSTRSAQAGSAPPVGTWTWRPPPRSTVTEAAVPAAITARAVPSAMVSSSLLVIGTPARRRHKTMGRFPLCIGSPLPETYLVQRRNTDLWALRDNGEAPPTTGKTGANVLVRIWTKAATTASENGSPPGGGGAGRAGPGPGREPVAEAGAAGRLRGPRARLTGGGEAINSICRPPRPRTAERRLRAVSERLEAAEDAIDRLERELAELRRRSAPRPTPRPGLQSSPRASAASGPSPRRGLGSSLRARSAAARRPGIRRRRPARRLRRPRAAAQGEEGAGLHLHRPGAGLDPALARAARLPS